MYNSTGKIKKKKKKELCYYEKKILKKIKKTIDKLKIIHYNSTCKR